MNFTRAKRLTPYGILLVLGGCATSPSADPKVGETPVEGDMVTVHVTNWTPMQLSLWVQYDTFPPTRLPQLRGRERVTTLSPGGMPVSSGCSPEMRCGGVPDAGPMRCSCDLVIVSCSALRAGRWPSSTSRIVVGKPIRRLATAASESGPRLFSEKLCGAW